MTMAVNEVLLIIFCILAVYMDLTRKKIPNLLSFPFMLAGLIYHLVSGGLEGLWFSAFGLLAGIALLFLPFAIGGVGGGDVKFLGAVGALQGARFVVGAMIIGAVLGGLMALVLLLIKGRLGITLRRLSGIILSPLFGKIGAVTGSAAMLKLEGWFSPPANKEEPKLFLPYAVPLAVGALLAVSGLAVLIMPGLNIWF